MVMASCGLLICQTIAGTGRHCQNSSNKLKLANST
jgi:hypothetical protein